MHVRLTPESTNFQRTKRMSAWAAAPPTRSPHRRAARKNEMRRRMHAVDLVAMYASEHSSLC